LAIEHFAILIDRLKANNQSAFKELVFSFTPRLMPIARLYSKDEEDAKDLLQDVFIIIYKKIVDFSGDEEKAFFAWAKRITINVCLSRSQKMSRNKEQYPGDLIKDFTFKSQVIEDLSAKEIMNLVQELPLPYRQVFALFAIEGYSHSEIAELLNIKESSSRSRFYRARLILKEHFNNLFQVTVA